MAHPFQLMQILMNKDAYVCQTHLLLKFLFSMYYFFYVPPCPLAYSILNYILRNLQGQEGSVIATCRSKHINQMLPPGKCQPVLPLQFRLNSVLFVDENDCTQYPLHIVLATLIAALFYLEKVNSLS